MSAGSKTEVDEASTNTTLRTAGARWAQRAVFRSQRAVSENGPNFRLAGCTGRPTRIPAGLGKHSGLPVKSRIIAGFCNYVHAFRKKVRFEEVHFCDG